MILSGLRDRVVRGDWGLRLLSLALAIVIYHVVKTESARGARGVLSDHDRTADAAVR